MSDQGLNTLAGLFNKAVETTDNRTEAERAQDNVKNLGKNFLQSVMGGDSSQATGNIQGEVGKLKENLFGLVGQGKGSIAEATKSINAIKENAQQVFSTGEGNLKQTITTVKETVKGKWEDGSLKKAAVDEAAKHLGLSSLTDQLGALGKVASVGAVLQSQLGSLKESAGPALQQVQKSVQEVQGSAKNLENSLKGLVQNVQAVTSEAGGGEATAAAEELVDEIEHQQQAPGGNENPLVSAAKGEAKKFLASLLSSPNATGAQQQQQQQQQGTTPQSQQPQQNGSDLVNQGLGFLGGLLKK